MRVSAPWCVLRRCVGAPGCRGPVAEWVRFRAAVCEYIQADKVLTAICKECVLKSVREEAASLLPFVQKLNQGPVPKTDVTRLKSLAYYKADRAGAGDRALEDAAAQFHVWLSEPTSVLRQFLCVMSAGGLFFRG